MSTRRTLTDRTFLADRIRSLLESRGLTLSKVSEISIQRFGRWSSFFLPHTLYHQLRSTNFHPSAYQIFAFSQISGFRFSDWFRLFGFDLEQLPNLQLLLPSPRTVLLDTSWADQESWFGFAQDRSKNRPVLPIAPLTSLIELTWPPKIRSFRDDRPGFLYAKLGTQDGLAFPDLLPGSIVRVDPRCINGLADREGKQSRRLFLIEHSRGLFCCRLRSVGNRFMVPISNQLSYAQVELEAPRQVRILGALDLEIRPLFQPKQPEVPRNLAAYWQPQALAKSQRLGEMLRRARANTKMSLRDISTQSLRLAALLDEKRYMLSPSSLFDYERLNVEPRDFHKCIALSLAYGLELAKCFEAIGIPLQNAGREPMPDRLVPELPNPVDTRETASESQPADRGFMRELLSRLGEVPFFLRQSSRYITGLPESSLENWFWIGGDVDPLYPYLENGLLAAVNRRKKRPLYFASKPAWQQPVYMLVKRNGTYACACCDVENGTLVIHPYSSAFRRSERIRYPQDAEIIGEIVSVVRRLP